MSGATEAPEGVYKVAEQLMPMLIEIDSVQPHPRNARQGNIEGIGDSLERFEQLKPIVVNAERFIIAGNHTWRGAKAKGWTHIAALFPTHLTPDEETAFLLADNRLPDTATWDDQALVALLEEQMEKGNLEGTGYGADDVEDLIAALGEVPELPSEATGADFAEDPSATAERWAGRNEGNTREVLLLVPKDRYDTFKEQVSRLMGRYDLDSAALTVLAAVEQADQQEA